MITSRKKISKDDLTNTESILYESVECLFNGTFMSFNFFNKDTTKLFVWDIHFRYDIINGCSKLNQFLVSGHEVGCYKIYYIDLYTEYDDSNFTNFDNVFLHILNWYHGDLDEYLLFKERKQKLININNL